jgi:hypothetical protein
MNAEQNILGTLQVSFDEECLRSSYTDEFNGESSLHPLSRGTTDFESRM